MKLAAGYEKAYGVAVEPPEGTTLGQQLGAAFSLENVAVNTARALQAPDTGAFDPAYDPLDDVSDEELLEIGGDRLARVKNANDLEALRQQRIREENARAAVDAGPLPGWMASVIAGAVDVTSVVPMVGAGANVLFRGAPAAARIGAAVLGTAADVAISEGVLQSTQETRTAEESLAAVLTGAAFGGAISGVGAAWGRHLDARKALDTATQDVLALGRQAFDPAATGPRDLSMGAKHDPSFRSDAEADLKLVGERALRVASKVLDKARLSAPGLVLATSRFNTFRRLGNMLADNAFVTEGVVHGRPASDVSALEIRIRQHDAVKAKVSGGLLQGFREAKAAGWTGGGRREFYEAVGDAMLNPTDTATHPVVRRYADQLKEGVVRPYYDKLVEAGVFEKREGSDPVEGWLHRLYDRDKLMADPEGFKKVLRDDFRRKLDLQNEVGTRVKEDRAKLDAMEARVGDLEQKRNFASGEVSAMARGGQAKGENANRGKAAQQRVDNIGQAILKVKQEQSALEDELRKFVKAKTGLDTTSPSWFKQWDSDEDLRTLGSDNIAADAAEDVFQTLTGNKIENAPVMSGVIVNSRGPLKGRTLDITSDKVRPWLNVDADEAFAKYIDVAASDLETYKTFGSFNMDDILKEAQEELTELQGKAKTKKERDVLAKDFLNQMQQARGLYNRVRGLHPPLTVMEAGANRALANARTLNFMRSLGNVVISSLSDSAKLVMQEGVTRVLGHGVADMVTGFRGFRLSKAQARQFGGALEFALSRRQTRLNDLTPPTTDGRVSRWVARAGQMFSRATLLPQYTDIIESMSWGLASTRVLKDAEAIAAGRSIPKSHARRLAAARISDDMARRIAKESQNATMKQSGLRLVDTDQWADRGAAAAFNSALVRDGKNAVTDPGHGDTPLWTDKALLKTAFQFKRFVYSATMRTLIPALQTHDMLALQGAATAVAMGALSVALTDYVADGELDRTRTTAQWINEAIDRSGYLAMFYEMNNLVPKQAGISGKIADRYNSIVPEQAQIETPTRFRQRSFAETIGGPTAGFIDDAFKTASGFIDKDITAAEFHRARRLVPAQNLFYLRWLFNAAEDAAVEKMQMRQRGERLSRTE